MLDFGDIPCLFQVVNSRGQTIEEDSKLFEIKAYTVEQIIKIDENGKKKNRIVNTELEIEKCDKVYLNETEYFSELNLSKYICVKPGQNLTSYGLLGDMNNDYRGVRIYINKCNGSDCYNNSVIETKFHNAKFIVTYLSFSSNIFNLNSNDLKYQLITTSSTISPGILKKIFFTFDKGKFDLYNSIIFKNKLSFSYIIANGNSIDVDLDPRSTMKRSDNTISYLSFHYSGNVVETKKEVQNIFTTLSIIGNIINIVLTIFKVINNYYSNKILFVDIFKNIFFAKEYMNINLNNYIHFNNNFKTKYNNNNKINLDISDEIGFNNFINRNKNIKPSSKKKMILFSNKKTLTKKK